MLNSQDTVTGFVLAGVGHRTSDGENFLVVKSGNNSTIAPLILLVTSKIYADTDISLVEKAFQTFTTREDIAIILINQHVRLLFG